jgi:hypothetical protein
MVVAVAATLAATSPCRASPIRFAATAEVPGPWVDLGQVANLSMLPTALRSQAARIELAKFVAGRSGLLISTAYADSRARAQIPALAPWIGLPAEQLIRVGLAPGVAPAPPEARPDCLQVREATARGEFALRSQFVPVACGAKPAATALRYDPQARAARASRDLRPGEIVPGAPLAVLADVRPGQTLYLRSKIGVVTVERAVLVVQPSVQGRPLFVKASDGSIFGAPAPRLSQ